MTGLNFLTDAYNVVDTHSSESAERQVEIMRECLKKFFYQNIVCGTAKFDMYKFTENDKLRPYITGVYHDKGFKVATNGHWLVVVNDMYPDEYEGKLLAKDGTEVECKYPNYRAVIPNYKEETDTKFKIDPERLKVALSKAKAERKMNKDATILIYLEGMGLRDDLANKLAIFLNGFPKADAYVKGKKLSDRVSYPLLLRHGENLGLFMPSLIPDEPGDIVVIEY